MLTPRILGLVDRPKIEQLGLPERMLPIEGRVGIDTLTKLEPSLLVTPTVLYLEVPGCLAHDSLELEVRDPQIVVNVLLQRREVAFKDIDQIVLIGERVQRWHKKMIVDASFSSEVAIHSKVRLCLESEILSRAIQKYHDEHQPQHSGARPTREIGRVRA